MLRGRLEMSHLSDEVQIIYNNNIKWKWKFVKLNIVVNKLNWTDDQTNGIICIKYTLAEYMHGWFI